MRKIKLIKLVAFSMLLFFIVPTKAQDKPTTKEKTTQQDCKYDTNKDGKVFMCESCGEVHDETGKCSKCGSELVETCVNDAKKHMMKHSNDKAPVNCKYDKNKDGKVFMCESCGEVHDEAGKCSKCGTNLKEMTSKEAKAKLMKKMK